MRRQEEARDELIQKIISLLKEKLPATEAKMLSNFAKQFYQNASLDDLLVSDIVDLYGALLTHWNFIHQRKLGESKVRVYNPLFEQHGWQSTHTVIEVISDNKPFMLESIRMVLTKFGLNIHLMLQLSGLKVVRNEQGVITDIPLIKNSDKLQGPYLSESPLFIEVDKQSDPQVLEEIRIAIEKTIQDVNLAVRDWSAMTGTMAAVIKELSEMVEKAEKSDQKETVNEIIELLQWINNNHFTYLGYCKRELISENNSYKWAIDQSACLGILSNNSECYFESFQDMPQAAQTLALSPYPLILGKTDRHSTVHRPAYTDFIVVKIFNTEGTVVGQHQFIGLYTSEAYHRSPQGIPLLRLKVKQILEFANLTYDSHDGKILVNIIETLPRDDLFHASVEELYELVVGISHLQERQRIRLFIRKDVFARTFSCLVYVPREVFNSKLREKMQKILLTELRGYRADFSTRFSDSTLARIHFIVRYKGEEPINYNFEELQQKLIDVARGWEQHFCDALIEHFGEEEGNRLFLKYGRAFPVGYRSDFNTRTAVYDVYHIEKLCNGNPLEMSFYRPLDEPEGVLRFKLYNPGNSIPLSDIIPMLECMGLRVINERPHEISPKGSSNIWINDFGMVQNSSSGFNADEVKEIFQEAFYHIWYHDAESDGFNRLVLGVGINWREVAMLRAYAKYLWQIGFTFSQAYIEDVLCGVPAITRDLVDLFKARFDPTVLSEKRKPLMNGLILKIKNSLEEVKNIDEDRIIRRYLQVILATIRTDFFQKDKEGKAKTYLSFKFDPSAIPELPLPRPLYEIFVYSPRVEGVHLRGAKVARGGIRWSDRREDFRTEVLGLMKAQQVKNAVIVPLGAKGGFVPKNIANKSTREEIMNEGIACYKIFIQGLLDLTDNLIDNKISPPQDVVRYDGDDPYLVVAADKGTATFSDIANAVSEQYHFWLGDAFASGGSSGYDHKKMAITARGAWESVKRHFREMGVDVQKTDFSVVGIGDMAGDVFGNGMLMSRHIKLIGAFNHQHIFLDPHPDPEASFKERERMFKLPRSTWEDYDSTLISAGGGVFSRSSKFILLSKEMQELLGIEKQKIVPTELIRALLKAPVDLLFNGGIGTYVKGSLEHNASVGDRANDGLRVNGDELQAKVVGEGGNLGFTQLGRVEYALNGGKLNTDAIDNSGGVNCSDQEVNIKILLNGVIAAGDLTEKQRNILLEEMTDEVAEFVLENNRNQIEAISVAEFNGNKSVQMHGRLIDHLERHANLDRAIEFLPSNEALLTRQQNGQGLTRPELSILLAYCKTLLKSEFLASDVLEDKYIALDLITAFPQVLREKYRKEMFSHRLKREIIAMQISNAVINDMGLGFIHRLQDETGGSIPDIIRGYIAAREIFRASRFREAVGALDFIVPSEVQVSMIHELNRLVRRGTRWFLRHRIATLDVEEVIKHFTPKMQLVRDGLHHALEGSSEEYLLEFAQELMADNVPEETALITAQMGAMFSALDIVDAAISHQLPVEDVTITYYAIGARLELGWFREQIKLHPVSNHWDSLARAAIRDDIDHQQRNLTVAVMTTQKEAGGVEAQIDAWMAQNKPMIDRWNNIINELKSLSKREFTMYSVALRELTELCNVSQINVQPGKKTA